MNAFDNDLDNPPTEAQMNALYDFFGTHAVNNLGMGAKFVATSTFDKKVFAQ